MALRRMGPSKSEAELLLPQRRRRRRRDRSGSASTPTQSVLSPWRSKYAQESERRQKQNSTAPLVSASMPSLNVRRHHLVRDRSSMRTTASEPRLNSVELVKKVDKLKAKLRSSMYSMGGVDWAKAFARFDADGSGELDRGEFRTALKQGGLAATLTDAEIEEIFKQVDADASGLVSAAEFGKFIKATPEELERRRQERKRPPLQEYIVLKRAVVREKPSLSSVKLGYLSKGQVVAVSHQEQGRLFCEPLRFSLTSQDPSGWCSEYAATGEQLLERLQPSELAGGGRESEFTEGRRSRSRLNLLKNDRKMHQLALAEKRANRRYDRRHRSAFRGVAAKSPQSDEHYSTRAADTLRSCTVPEAILLTSMLERHPRKSDWDNLLDIEWPAAQADLAYLLRLQEQELLGYGTESRGGTSQEEAVAAAMLRWRQERGAARALASALPTELEAAVKCASPGKG